MWLIINAGFLGAQMRAPKRRWADCRVEPLAKARGLDKKTLADALAEIASRRVDRRAQYIAMSLT